MAQAKKKTAKKAPSKQAAKKPASKKPVKSASAKKPKTVAPAPAKKSKTPKKPAVAKSTQPKRKKINLPKKTETASYSCIWRMYLVTNPRTNAKMKKRFWIVIGDGHKRYRKFETQLEAIKYFRSLKKYAKMRVQSADSKKFIKTSYTLYEMMYNGLDVEEIRAKAKAKARANKIQTTEEIDLFSDEFASYDTVDYVDTGTFDEAEINKVLAEAEGDSILVDDDGLEEDQEIVESDVVLEDKKEEEQSKTSETFKYEQTKTTEINPEDNYELSKEIVLTEEVQEEQNYGDYNYTQTTLLEDSSNNNEVEKTNLYELASTQEVDEKPVLVESETSNSNNDDIQLTKSEVKEADDIELTQYQTALQDYTVEDVLPDGKYHSKKRVFFWVLIILIALVLSAIVAFVLLFVLNGKKPF